MKKNCIVAQSGGPTAAINASLAGVVSGVMKSNKFDICYGSLNGITGILNNTLVELSKTAEQPGFIEQLTISPAMYLGSCRFKMPEATANEEIYKQIFACFEQLNIGAFFYIGGNDSQDTTNKIAKFAEDKGYALRAIGIPKTVDNDLPMTDHCPGYGSVVKYLCATIRQLALDHESMGNHDLVSIVEVMGRDVSVVSTHDASLNPVVRSIINADNKVDITAETVSYSLKAHKVFLFNAETEERIYFEV
jgi:6-phosphofructokinase 1